MGAAQSWVTAEDLERLLWLRDGISVDVVVWDPIRRGAWLLVSGAGVEVEPPGPGCEAEGVAIERLMSRIPVEIDLGHEGERTFTPPGPTVDSTGRYPAAVWTQDEYAAMFEGMAEGIRRGGVTVTDAAESILRRARRDGGS